MDYVQDHTHEVMDKYNIPFSRIRIGIEERTLLQEVLDSGWLTTAGMTRRFEDEFAQMIGSRFACAVNSCTAALHLGAEALGIRQGSKVFVPTMTFTASAEIIRYLGADPILLDVDYGTNLITPAILEEAILHHPDVQYMVLVHYGGQMAEMPALNSICANHNIRILEDAAHAFPARLNGQSVGSFGNITCFSFYANKTITTGEGGMLVTDDEELHARIKTMRLHGINRDIWGRFTTKGSGWEYDVVEAGFKYNMPDLAAAIGLGQLGKAERWRKTRQDIAARYFQRLQGIPHLDLPVLNVDPQDHAWHLFPMVIKDSSRLNRNDFIDSMSKVGIGTSVHYKPLHRMTYYKDRYGLRNEDYPNSEKTWKGNVSLPLHSFLELEDVDLVCDAVIRLLG